MKEFLCAVLVGVLCLPVFSSNRQSSPMVQIYSHSMAELGKANILLCHVSSFYPPLIAIDLLKNGVQMLGANQTELAFEEDWHYHCTKFIPFIPEEGDKYACKVTHLGKPRMHFLEDDL